MRVGPFTIGRAAAAANPGKLVAPEPKGASGTINYQGFLQTDEYLPDLRGLQALEVFDKMLRSDGSVQEAVEHIFAPIKNATVTVEAPEAPSEDELVAAALVRDSLFETLDQPFLEYIDQALDYLSFGHQVFETSWQVVEREVSYQVPGEFDVDAATGRRTPKTVTVPARQWLVWDRFEQRMQKTIWKWQQRQGKLLGVVQQVWKDDSFKEIPISADQLIVMINKRRGDQFEGRSILRAAYKAWYLKELIEKVEAVSLERWGVGIPIAYPPLSAKDDAQVIGRLEAILQDLRGGESTYIVSPGPRQTSGPNGQEGYLFELMTPSGTAPDFKSAKEYHRAEIKAAVLARFAELGHAQTGARSTGDTQSKVWYDALHAVAKYFEDVHQPAINRLVDANLPGISRYPRLAFSGIEARDLREYADAISSLVGSGAVSGDGTFRGWVREEIDAPPEDETDDSELGVDAEGNPVVTPGALKQRRNGKPDPGQQQLPVEAE